EPTSQRVWFALDTPLAAPNPNVFFTYDYQLLSVEPVTQPVAYSVVSYTTTHSTDSLSLLARRHEISLPGARNPRSSDLARELRRDSGSDAAFVSAVLERFRTGGFQYSLTPPRLQADSVDDFVFNTKVGFCGHFASAFTALMRAAGVPARV